MLLTIDCGYHDLFQSSFLRSCGQLTSSLALCRRVSFCELCVFGDGADVELKFPSLHGLVRFSAVKREQFFCCTSFVGDGSYSCTRPSLIQWYEYSVHQVEKSWK